MRASLLPGVIGCNTAGDLRRGCRPRHAGRARPVAARTAAEEKDRENSGPQRQKFERQLRSDRGAGIVLLGVASALFNPLLKVCGRTKCRSPARLQRISSAARADIAMQPC